MHDHVVVEEQERIKSVLAELSANRDGEEIIFLWQASLAGDTHRVQQLLEQGLNPNSELVCPLTAAVFSGKIGLVETLLFNGANVEGNEEKNNFNLTPLIHAASGGDIQIVELLVTNGADLSYKIYEGDKVRSAQTYVIESGHYEVVEWLNLQKNA